MTYVLWASLGFTVSLLASWAGARVALAPLVEQAPTTWVDRARLAFPARAASRFALIFLPTLAAVSASFLEPGQGAGTWLASAAAAVPALVAATVVRLHVERVIRRRRVGLGEMLRGWLSYWMVAVPHLVVALVCVAFVGDEPTGRAWLIVATAALATAAACAGSGVMLARWLGLARPASDRLARAVAVASESTGVRPRAIYEIDLRMANAFALPAMRLLLFTGDAVRALDDAQIAAISRHELGHVSEPLRVVAARVLNAVLLITALVAARPLSGALTPEPGLARLGIAIVVLLGAVLFAVLVGRPLSRRMEERADAVAHGRDAHDARGGHDAQGPEYARALEAIYAHNLVPAVLSTRGTHPHLYDRMVSAGFPPPWPRPAPPSRGRLRAALAVSLGIATLALATAFVVGGTFPIGLAVLGLAL